MSALGSSSLLDFGLCAFGTQSVCPKGLGHNLHIHCQPCLPTMSKILSVTEKKKEKYYSCSKYSSSWINILRLTAEWPLKVMSVKTVNKFWSM